jgi:hypothetical protein
LSESRPWTGGVVAGFTPGVALAAGLSESPAAAAVGVTVVTVLRRLSPGLDPLAAGVAVGAATVGAAAVGAGAVVAVAAGAAVGTAAGALGLAQPTMRSDASRLSPATDEISGLTRTLDPPEVEHFGPVDVGWGASARRGCACRTVRQR